MIRYFYKLILLGISIILILSVYSRYRLNEIYNNPSGQMALEINGNEIFLSIQKSKQKYRTRKLLLGDSVGQQIYSNKKYSSDSLYSLACNQAVTMAGHYCLLRSFLENNEDCLPEEVILYLVPLVYQNNLDKYSFHYFLKPFFYNDDYHGWLDSPILTDRIKSVPYYLLSSMSITRSINYSPKYTLENHSDSLLSPISEVYLNKIAELCASKNIKLNILPGPISENKFNSIKNLKIESPLLNDIFDKVQVYPDSLFLDLIHFKDGYIPQDPLGLLN